MTVTETLRKDPETGKWRWYKPEEAPGLAPMKTHPNAGNIVKGDLNATLHQSPKWMHKGTPQEAEHYDRHGKPCFNSRAKLREWLARDADTGDTHHAWNGKL